MRPHLCPSHQVPSLRPFPRLPCRIDVRDERTVQIAWFVATARPQHETDSSLPNRNFDQQYHGTCCACQMRELDMQVQARTGQSPASVRLPESAFEAYFWLSPLPNGSVRKTLHAVIRRGVMRRVVSEAPISTGRLLEQRINILILSKVCASYPDDGVLLLLILGHAIRASHCDESTKEEGS